MFYCGLMKVEKLKKCNVSNAGIAHLHFHVGLQNGTFPTVTLCLCQVHIADHTGRYSTGQCHISGQTNAEINKGSCRQIQEPVKHVRRSVSQERSSLGHDTSTKCAGTRFVCPQCQCTLSSRGGLTAHVKIVHEKLARYQCDHCGKGYSHRSH